MQTRMKEVNLRKIVKAKYSIIVIGKYLRCFKSLLLYICIAVCVIYLRELQ